MDNRSVDIAFEMLLSEIENAINELNKDRGKILEFNIYYTRRLKKCLLDEIQEKKRLRR